MKIGFRKETQICDDETGPCLISPEGKSSSRRPNIFEILNKSKESIENMLNPFLLDINIFWKQAGS